MNRYILSVLLLSAFLPTGAIAQQTEVLRDVNARYNEAVSLYEQKKYAASSRAMSDFLTLSTDLPTSERRAEAAYCLAASSYHLRQDGAYNALARFVDDYPYSARVDQSTYYLGTLSYEQHNYSDAIDWFSRTDEDYIAPSDLNDFHFRYGYALLQNKEYASARLQFSRLLGTQSRYENASVYYIAYIDYLSHHYTTALRGFEQVKDLPEYVDFVPYYIVQIYYAQQRYDELIPMAQSLIERHPDNENNLELYRILGECAYRNQDYPQAIQYLSLYKQKSERVVRREMYLLGTSYYKTGQYSEAVSSLRPVTTEADALAQSAYLQIGLSDLRLQDKASARLAFEQAAAMDFDADVREEAAYNYALCTYDLSFAPFNESVKIFETFLADYPNSSHRDEVYTYLTNVYLTTENPSEALASINRIQSPSASILEAKARVLYTLGDEAYQSTDYPSAIRYLTEAVSLSRYNAPMAALSLYRRGECRYALQQYAEARADFRQFLSMNGARSADVFNLAYYNLGYTHWAQHAYTAARDEFIKYLNIEPDHTLATAIDAECRIGDCYLADRMFDAAQKYYTAAASTKRPSTDYATFQQAIVYGLKKDYPTKIHTLETLLSDYPSSDYVDDALYEIGHSYMMLDKNDAARTAYQRLADQYPTSPLARKALLQSAMLYENDDNYPSAILAYERVASDYRGTEEAETALESLEKCYVRTGDVAAYSDFLQSVGRSSLSVEKSDSLQYLSAERQYILGNFPEAIKGYKTYLDRYPQGRNVVNAHHALASCYYTQGDAANALSEYRTLISPTTAYTLEAVRRAAELTYDTKDYAAAYDYFSQLKSLSSESSDVLAARLGMLRSAALRDDFEGTISIASEMIPDARTPIDDVREARYRRAKAYLSLSQSDKALPDLKELSLEPRTAYGAESAYLLAQAQFAQGDAAAAEQTIFAFLDSSSPHTYWVAQSFILLSDIYVSEGDDFQAKQYLLSLQNNYAADDQLSAMIATRLAAISERENAQIETPEVLE